MPRHCWFIPLAQHRAPHPALQLKRLPHQPPAGNAHLDMVGDQASGAGIQLPVDISVGPAVALAAWEIHVVYRIQDFAGLFHSRAPRDRKEP